MTAVHLIAFNITIIIISHNHYQFLSNHHHHHHVSHTKGE